MRHGGRCGAVCAAGSAAWAVVLGVMLACSPGGPDDRVVAKLDEIEKRLEKIEQAQEKLLSRPAAAERPSRPGEDYSKVYEIPVGDSPVRGPADAPVTLVEFSDFQCPFCGRANPLLDALAEKYPEDLKLVFKHFPLTRIHPAARPLAVASLAAEAQGRFWPFHDVLFENQASLEATDEALARYAQQAGLDVERFQRDLRENKTAYERQIQADLEAGRQADVRGTPTLYINGRKVQNRSIAGMSAMVDAALKR